MPITPKHFKIFTVMVIYLPIPTKSKIIVFEVLIFRQSYLLTMLKLEDESTIIGKILSFQRHIICSVIPTESKVTVVWKLVHLSACLVGLNRFEVLIRKYQYLESSTWLWWERRRGLISKIPKMRYQPLVTVRKGLCNSNYRSLTILIE